MNQAIPSRSSPAMDGFERTELDIGGVRTVIHAIGSGRPLIFLHGAGTFPGFDFARLLAPDIRVIIPYHAGFGESADGNDITTIDDHVLHYADLIDRLGLSDFDMAGFSLGGWIAAEFAARRPAGLRKLALVAPAGLVVPEYPAPDLSLVGPQDLPGYLTHDPQVALGYFPKAPDPAFGQALGREMAALGRLLGDEPQGNPKLSRWLHRISTPVLLLWGAEDRMRPAAQAAAWLEAVPDARLARIPSAGHLLFEEKPEEAVACLRDFLAS